MLMRFDPFRDLDRFSQQVDQAIRQSGGSVPMDAVRSGHQIDIYFDIPGIDSDHIDLTVERDVLTVTATRRYERGDDVEVLANERPEGTFTRRVVLGESLDTTQLEASYDAGVLHVTIPVAEQAKPRKIAVSGKGERQAIDTTASDS